MTSYLVTMNQFHKRLKFSQDEIDRIYSYLIEQRHDIKYRYEWSNDVHCSIFVKGGGRLYSGIGSTREEAKEDLIRQIIAYHADLVENNEEFRKKAEIMIIQSEEDFGYMKEDGMNRLVSTLEKRGVVFSFYETDIVDSSFYVKNNTIPGNTNTELSLVLFDAQAKYLKEEFGELGELDDINTDFTIKFDIRMRSLDKITTKAKLLQRIFKIAPELFEGEM